VSVVRRSSGTVYVDSTPQDGVGQPLHAGERIVTAGVLGLGGGIGHSTHEPDETRLKSAPKRLRASRKFFGGAPEASRNADYPTMSGRRH